MIKKITQIVVLVFIVCALASCATPTISGKRVSQVEKSQIRQAEKLIQEEQYQEAASIFWNLSENKPSPQREALQLRAAEAVLHPQTKLQAQQYLGAIDEKVLTQDLLVRKRVATAELKLLNGQPQLALEVIPENLINASPKYKPHVLAVRAKALQSAQQIRESIETRIALNPLLTNKEQYNKNNNLIWQSLLKSNRDELTEWQTTNSDPELAAWLSLALIQKQPYENLPALDNEVQQWRKQHQGHKVPNNIVDSIAQDWASYHISPNKIALLLPMTGRYSQVAEAIYAGIITAREFGETFNPPPELVLYDIGDDASSAASYFRRAVGEGADLVIGPLQKEAVNILAKEEQLAVPTLTLNYADNLHAEEKNLYQFGLLPEDEARQVAERASLDNLHTALVLVPESEWGTRILGAFTSRFVELGGVVLQAERYYVNDSDHSVAIKNLLQINQSEKRRRNIQAIIKQNVEFEPRRRQDADFVFLAATPPQARLLRPQLNFHFATDLPVYATSHVFSGNENIAADQDINGITYCDIPWLLSNDTSIELLRDSLDLQESSSPSRLPRFAALGIDAYQIIPHLQRLAAYEYDSYHGTTGRLSIHSDNRIYRELIWAKFQNGRPQIIGFLPYANSQPIPQQ